MIRIVIADNHLLVRAGIRSLLAGRDDIEVVGEAGDGDEALRLIEQHRPQVVLMDIAMPVMNGLEATARLKELHPSVRVLILSIYLNEEFVLGALKAGAAGYLVKDASASELAEAIVTVARGDSYLSPSVSAVVTEYVRRTGRPAEKEPLTSRQREILKLIADGKTTKEIAATLSISVKTVEAHRARLMDALDLHDIAALVRYAVRMGIVRAGD